MSDKPRDISEISITPERDEVARRTGRVDRRTGRAEAPRQSHFNGLLVFVMALMAITVGIGGYALYESNKLLIAGQRNIEDLDNRLAATGKDVSKTLQAMQEQIKTSEHEIRKLWDVSNKKNKNLIKANENGLANVKKQVAILVTELGEFAEGFDAIKSASDDAVAEVSDLRTEFIMTQGRVEDQTDLLIANERQIAILGKQIKEADEAIRVIDQHRAQVNQELRFLRDRVQILSENL